MSISLTGGAAAGGGSGRELLSANRTYYVRADGSNSNSGLVNSAGGAFLTIQKAYDVVVSSLDLGGYAVTIQVGAVTTLTPATGLLVAQPWTGGGSVTLDLNGSTINAGAGGCVYVTATLPGVLTVQGGTLSTSANGVLIYHVGAGTIQFGAGMTFGPAGTADQIFVRGAGARVLLAANYTISGGGRYHLLNVGPSMIEGVGLTVTLSGTPAFGSAFAGVQGGQINCYGNTYSGSATGARYSADRLGLIDARGGASYLPGNAAGTETNSGKYV